MTRDVPNKLYFRIGEISDIVGVKPYVLRYWESEFKVLKPLKSKSKQRVYRRKDILTILLIKHLLYDKKYTIAGAKRRILELQESGSELTIEALENLEPTPEIDQEDGIIDETSELLKSSDKVVAGELHTNLVELQKEIATRDEEFKVLQNRFNLLESEKYSIRKTYEAIQNELDTLKTTFKTREDRYNQQIKGMAELLDLIKSGISEINQWASE